MTKPNFNKSIYENRMGNGAPLIAAHRGTCGANIPCNSLAAFKLALDHGADVIELDVSKSLDGQLYVFHPGTEPIFIGCDKYLSQMTSEEIDGLRLLNQDKAPTSYKIPKLSEAFELLKDRAYINVDKFWTDIEGISNEIRKSGVEKQAIVKTYVNEDIFDAVAKHSPDLMYIPMVKTEDTVTDMIISKGINIVGIEAIFASESDPIASDEYIKSIHERGLLYWTNAIIYNEKTVLTAHHSDDISLTVSPDKGWGWLVDKGADFIQTDWTLSLKNYLLSRK